MVTCLQNGEEGKKDADELEQFRLKESGNRCKFEFKQRVETEDVVKVTGREESKEMESVVRREGAVSDSSAIYACHY